MPNTVYINIYIENEYFVGNILDTPEVICLHTVK